MNMIVNEPRVLDGPSDRLNLAWMALGDCGVNTAGRGARGPFRGMKGGVRAPPRPPPRLRRRGSVRKPHRTRSLERREGVNVNDADAPSTGATGVFAVHGIRVSKATTLHHTFSVPRPRRGRGLASPELERAREH